MPMNTASRNVHGSNTNIRRYLYHQFNQSFQMNHQNTNTIFLENWPTPAETASMKMQQTLTRLMGTIENVEARMGKMEMSQRNRMNGWTF